MKRIIKYLNDNRKKCVLGVQNFMPENTRIVRPCEIVTVELDLEDDDVIFFKTWKHDDKVLIQTHKKEVWKVQSK